AGLSHHNGRDAGFQNGLGAQIGMTVKLGDPRAVKGSDKFALRMNAGPVLLRNNGQRSAPSLISASLSPGYKADVSFAGRAVATHYTAAGFAEAKAKGLDGQDRHGVKTLGWVGIGIGVAALAFGGFMIAVFESSKNSD
ncbi:MAG: hypothetical protein ABL918_12635, partial [Chakrabartia sp.]